MGPPVASISLVLAQALSVLCGKQVYEQLIGMSNLNTSVVPLLTAPDTGKCAQLCFQEDSCSYFRFQTGTCSLYETTPFPSGDEATGSVYFGKLATCPISSGYALVENARVCLKVNNSEVAWNESESQCESEGGRLLVLSNSHKWDLVVQWLADEGYGIKLWVGMKRTDGVLKWTDGTTKVKQWTHGSPRPSPKDCGYLHVNLVSGNGGVNGNYCTTKRFICEITL